MKVLIKKVLNEKEGKGGWKTLTVKLKPLNKAAKNEFPNKEAQISLAPDNKIKKFEGREFELRRPSKFFGSYYPRLSENERAKSKQGGGNFKNYHQSKEEKPTKVKKRKNKSSGESNQLQYYVNSTMRLVCAKIEGGDKKLSKLNSEELIEESIRLAKKLYKKIHK